MAGRSYIFENGYHAICRVFPNPATENLTIESDTVISKVTLYNYMGSPIAEQSEINNFTTSLSLSNVPPGLYLINIRFIHGEIITRRIIKK